MKKKRKSLLGILLAGMLCLTACGGSGLQDEAVMKIDGQEIMRSEYMVYLYTTTKSFLSAAGEDVWTMDFDGQTADELVEERTISTIQSVIAAKADAKANDITLSDDQKKEAKAATEQFIAGVSEEDLEKMGVDAETLQPLMEDSYLYTLVHQTIAEECEVDAEDMEAYYQENKAQMQKDYTSLKLQTILQDDEKKAEEAAKRAKKGEDFKALFEEYDVDPTADQGGEMTLHQNELQAGFGLTDVPEKGDIVGPLQIGEGYFILHVLEKTVPTDAEVKELAESNYRMEVQTSYTEARFNELMKGQKVEKIENVWKTLEKFH